MSTSITKPDQAKWGSIIYLRIDVPYPHSGDRRSEQAVVVVQGNPGGTAPGGARRPAGGEGL